jgi:5-methyltetrahydropteroyltriglutamate--homocysteine methyltransferase
MRRGERRILTTHTGSLPRPPDLVALMLAREAGASVDEALLERRVAEATREVVARQADTGIDVVNDGETSKPSYSTYVKDRLSGFDGDGRPPAGGTVEANDFPGYARTTDPSRGQMRFPTCTGPVTVRDRGAVERDIDVLRASLTGRETEVFLSSVSPGQIARFMGNAYYPSHEAYVYALADAMRPEYQAIVGAGFVLQVDCPDLASGRINSEFASLSLEEWRTVALMHVDALNHALQGLPPEAVRLHLCWGNYAGPHHRDVPLTDVLDIALKALVGGLSFEAANPRHAHEWAVFRDVQLPEGFVLIPGVIESCSLYIEHPELVAQRLQRFVDVAGFDNVIAGTDCGFGTFVSSTPMHPGIVWAKLAAMTEGAAMVQR